MSAVILDSPDWKKSAELRTDHATPDFVVAPTLRAGRVGAAPATAPAAGASPYANTNLFFKTVLPEQGLKCIVELNPDKKLRHHFFNTRAEAAAKTLELDAAGKNVYFACAAFITKESRKQENAKYARSFWVDVDVDPANPEKYPSLEAARADIERVCKTLQLSPPLVVESGAGVHAYWVLDADVEVDDWVPVAELLKQVLEHVRFKQDRTRTADSASIMRPVGTHWRKRGERLVKLVRQGTPTSLARFKAALISYASQNNVTAPAASAPAFDNVNANDLLGPEREYAPSSATRIIELCPTVRHVADKRGDVEEPLWRAMLGLVKHTTEGVARCHDWSSGYAGYSRKETQDKIERWTAGPTTCAHFRGTNGNKCAGCTQDVKSPIMLGEEPAAAVSSPVGAVGQPATTTSGAWPDPNPVEAPLPPVLPFSLSYLPTAFSPYVKDQADLMQCPQEYIAVPLMIAASACLGNKVAIAPKKHDDGWLVAPVIWGAVVGRPGTMKSPAQEVAMRPLSAIEAAMAKAYDTRRQQHQLDKLMYEAALAAAKKAANKGQAVSSLPVEPEEPQPERLLVNDSTVQKLSEVLRWSPWGALVTRDELVALLEQLSAEGQEGARGFYLTAWNGLSSYRVDRIGRGSFIIPRLALWLYGGIQPSKLQPYVRQAVSGGNGDDGLIQRIQLLVWPDPPRAWRNVDRPGDLEAMQRVDEVFIALRRLDPVVCGCEIDELGGRPAWLHFTSEAQDLFDSWRQKLEDSLRAGDKHPALESHLAKYRSLIPALALVIHLADGHTGPVGAVPLKKAIAWGYYLHSHAKRVYASATNAAGFSARALADKIKAGKLGSAFTAREVHRHGWAFLSTPEDVRSAVDWLIDAGWIHASTTRPGTGGGRPTEVFAINPKAQG